MKMKRAARRHGGGAIVALAALMLAPPAHGAGDDLATDVLWVEGMTLPDCDEIGLQLLLESLPGVAAVQIDFSSGRTAVEHDPGQVSREDLVAEVVNRGFAVPWVTDVFVVGGWDVPRRDAPAVQLLVGSLQGVAEIEVDEATGRTIVRYDPARLRREDIVAEVGNLDWQMTLAEPDAGAPGAGR